MIALLITLAVCYVILRVAALVTGLETDDLVGPQMIEQNRKEREQAERIERERQEQNHE